MRVIEREELNKILADHKRWLETRYADKPEGKKANLREANLYEADLRGADLRGADLREANLREANLRGADLREADLRKANLYGANLRGADLYGANLRGANLYEADLRGADLRGADLREADLRKANLRGADLREADLRKANLRKANLYEAKDIGYKQANFVGIDLDFCFIPLACRGLQWTIDRRLAVQLIYHLCSYNCDDEEIKAAQNSLLALANQFHRADECGVLEPKILAGDKNHENSD